MSNENNTTKNIGRLVSVTSGLPWLEILAGGWKVINKLWRGLSREGMYEVLEHDTTLELKDPAGEKAHVYKRQKVCYLQDNISAYLDQAWGDGSILNRYHCSPGKKVDEYRLGPITYILISLQGIRNRGDVDEFNIDWLWKNGFRQKVEQWGTTVSHRTKRLKTQIIFPELRLPKSVQLIEYTTQKMKLMDSDAFTKLGDGRWRLVWEISFLPDTWIELSKR